MQPALTPLQQRRVWEAWFAGEVRALYFADLATVYRRRQRVVTWATVFTASGAVASLLAAVPAEWHVIRLVFAAVTAGLSFSSVVTDLPRQATASADLHARWNQLARAYERLWDGMYAPDAPETLQRLDDEAAALSEASTPFPAHGRRLRKWHAHVAAHHEATRSWQIAAA